MDLDDPNLWIATVAIYLVVILVIWKMNFTGAIDLTTKIILSVIMFPVIGGIIMFMGGD